MNSPADLVSILPAPLQPFVPWIILFLAINAYLLVPSMPLPTTTSGGFYTFLYNVLAKIAGNYGTASAPPALPPTTGAKS